MPKCNITLETQTPSSVAAAAVFDAAGEYTVQTVSTSPIVSKSITVS